MIASFDYFRKGLEREEYYSRESVDVGEESDMDAPALETASAVCIYHRRFYAS